MSCFLITRISFNCENKDAIHLTFKEDKHIPTLENLEFKTKWLKVIYFATCYGFVVSMLYLFGYWSTFDINILEYIKISDVIKISIYPILTSVGITITGIILGSFYERWSSKPNIQKSEISKKINKWTNFICKYAVIVTSIFFIVAALYNRDRIVIYMLFSIICPTVASYILVTYKAEMVKKLISFPGYEALILFLFLSILSLAFGYGKVRSLSILETGSCFYINVSIFKDKELFQDQKRLKYLGLGGNFMFFLSEDNTKTYILEPSKIPILELYKSKSQTRTEAIKEIKNKEGARITH